ncbi:MAG: preprotein translocase subunit SecE [Patescibacteria group bacterium]
MGIINYFQETQHELKHVTWPTRKQAISFTVFVVVLTIATSLFLGLFDFIFSTGLKVLLLN